MVAGELWGAGGAGHLEEPPTAQHELVRCLFWGETPGLRALSSTPAGEAELGEGGGCQGRQKGKHKVGMLLEQKAERDPRENRPGCRDAAGARGSTWRLPSAIEAPAPL